MILAMVFADHIKFSVYNTWFESKASVLSLFMKLLMFIF